MYCAFKVKYTMEIKGTRSDSKSFNAVEESNWRAKKKKQLGWDFRVSYLWN